MRHRALAALASAALLALSGCGAGSAHGTVAGKHHEPSHTTWSTVPRTKQVCTTTTRRTGGKTSRSRSCHSVSAGTRHVSHTTPECWELLLDTGADVCVSRHTWLTTSVGDKY
ncbi:hypothetical protein [Streptomyces sp. NPDC094468]|uniref:hypothetical protein n=1 Tax=Streptomyces sp. NPDC094468 TaxID=3366066 RepID=UPI00381D3442